MRLRKGEKFPKYPKLRESFFRYVSKEVNSDLYASALVGWKVSESSELDRDFPLHEIRKILADEIYRRNRLLHWMERFLDGYITNPWYEELVQKDIETLRDP